MEIKDVDLNANEAKKRRRGGFSNGWLERSDTDGSTNRMLALVSSTTLSVYDALSFFFACVVLIHAWIQSISAGKVIGAMQRINFQPDRCST